MSEHDRKVMATNMDAVSSKFSCVKAGYYADEFIPVFTTQNPIHRRNPIINLGYYSRVMAIRRTIEWFATTCVGDDLQVVSIGAGYDTNGLWALKQFRNVKKVFELDFFDVLFHKLKIFKNEWGSMFSFLHSGGDFPSYRVNDENGGLLWSSDKLCLVGCDLRGPTKDLQTSLEACGFDRAKPTLFLAECCLVYMDLDVTERLLGFFSTLSSTAVIAVYEQVNPYDSFGRMMMENLNTRGCSLLGILPSVAAVEARFRACGFPDNRVELMAHFNPLIHSNRVEMIDEMEEFNLFQNHYFFGVASNSKQVSTSQISSIFDP